MIATSNTSRDSRETSLFIISSLLCVREQGIGGTRFAQSAMRLALRTEIREGVGNRVLGVAPCALRSTLNYQLFSGSKLSALGSLRFTLCAMRLALNGQFLPTP